MATKKFESSPAVIESVQGMNSVTGNINLRTELLDDISTKLFHLMDDMDKAAYNGHEKLYYKEHHQEVRMLATFMNYVMKDVRKDTEDIVSLGETLHEEIIKKGCGVKMAMERYSFTYSINLTGSETPVTGSFTAVDEFEQKVVQHVELEALNREGIKGQAQILKNVFLAQKVEDEQGFENIKKIQSLG